jgi:hypothetical protein
VRETKQTDVNALLPHMTNSSSSKYAFTSCCFFFLLPHSVVAHIMPAFLYIKQHTKLTQASERAIMTMMMMIVSSGDF